MSENTEVSEKLSAPIKEFSRPKFREDELVLYFHPYNFYSQKVRRKINNEKNLSVSCDAYTEKNKKS